MEDITFDEFLVNGAQSQESLGINFSICFILSREKIALFITIVCSSSIMIGFES